MSDAFALLWLPFLASLVLTAIHTPLGLQILARRVIFVDLALAQIAALGATLAFLLGHAVGSGASYAWSALFTTAAALLLAGTRRWSGRVPQEALIGILYVVAAAAAFLLVERAPQGTEHIRQVLAGNILFVSPRDLYFAVPLYAAIGLLLRAMRRPLAQPGEGLRGWGLEFLFYAAFGLVVTSSVALAGVLLVFAFLIIPAAIGVLYAEGRRALFVGWAMGAVLSAAGLAASYAWELSTGSAMVCTFGAAFALAGALRPVFAGDARRRGEALLAARALGAAALVLSGAWIAAAPRADQPLLDSLEYGVPGVRSLYMSALEQRVYADTARYAVRYQNEAERLNSKEAASRWQGAALSDEQVARLSSMLRSYGEMRKGEQYAQREVRDRARERGRWTIGAAFLCGGLLLLPWSSLRPGRRGLPARR